MSRTSFLSFLSRTVAKQNWGFRACLKYSNQYSSLSSDKQDQSLLEEMFGDFLRRLQGHYRQTAIPGILSLENAAFFC